MMINPVKEINATRQTIIGLGLGGSIFAAWAGLHIWLVFFFEINSQNWPLIPLLVVAQCWFYVGMFIVAHDAMHGGLVPGNLGLNNFLGRALVMIYAGFGWEGLRSAHMEHHKNPGTELDPDFNAADPKNFWPWYLAFFRRYFGLGQLAIIVIQVVLYMYVFGASIFNIWIFWALPSIASSVQLFYFGTFLPHRHEGSGFVDQHNARTNNYSWLVSLLTCFHFGYHHEHHLYPNEPWWRLPTRRLAPNKEGV